MKLPRRLAHLSKLVPEANRQKTDCVYVIQCNEFTKIGIAANVSARLADLQVGNPYELVLLGWWRSDDAVRDEEIIHAHLNAYRVRGEWFKLPLALLEHASRKLSRYDMAQTIMPKEHMNQVRLALSRLNKC